MTPTARPTYVDEAELLEAARQYVAQLGIVNIEFLVDNLNNVAEKSDAFRTLREALHEQYRPVSPGGSSVTPS